MAHDFSPDKYESVQDLLSALGFEANGDFFVRNNVQIQVTEIIGCTPTTFYQKAKDKDWLKEEADITPFLYLPVFQMD